MLSHLKNLLLTQGIELCAPIKLSHCVITRPYKLSKHGFSDTDALTAFMLAVPYLTRQGKRNLSAYASPRDYHLYFRRLFDGILPLLEASYPQYRFVGFADDSPIEERSAAAMAGLGILGDNGMLITDKYSSFVFLGEIITDAPVDVPSPLPIRRCEGCGKCKTVCPMGELGVCLSALTQKKGELLTEEKSAILQYGSAWGCDLCQNACPHTQKAIESGSIYTSVPFFEEKTIPYLTLALLDSMSDGEFAERAYSWRGRDTVRRNLTILERGEDRENQTEPDGNVSAQKGTLC